MSEIRRGVPAKEAEQSNYLKAARFDDGGVSQQAYFQLNRAIHEEGNFHLAAFHLTDQEQLCWYVSVVGYKPPEGLEATIDGFYPQANPATFLSDLEGFWQGAIEQVAGTGERH